MIHNDLIVKFFPFNSFIHITEIPFIHVTREKKINRLQHTIYDDTKSSQRSGNPERRCVLSLKASKTFFKFASVFWRLEACLEDSSRTLDGPSAKYFQQSSMV